MIPQWVSGAAARDAARGGGGDLAEGPAMLPILAGMVIIGAAAFSMSKDAGVGWLVAIVLGVAAFCAAMWAAIKEGDLGWLAASGFTVVSGCAAYFFFIKWGEENGWLWSLLFFALVGICEIAIRRNLKRSARS